MARNGEELGARVVLAAELGKPWATTTANLWSHSDCLHVRHCGRAPENTDSSWEWGLQPRLPHLALEGLDETSLLSANVCARTTMKVHVEVHATSTRVFADVPS